MVVKAEDYRTRNKIIFAGDDKSENGMEKVLVIGAGPAGLTAAYELLKKSGGPDDYEVVVLEETDRYGGISRTVNYHGNRMDMGGHRLFSKVPEVNEWWERMMPAQGKPAYDDSILGRAASLAEGGPDPETDDRVMLRRNRLSRIFFRRKFFDYPVSLKWETLKNMGLGTTLQVGCSYLKSCLFRRPEESLEDFYINRFGRKLYTMFFERYTENLWGRHPSEISPEWGAQRVKGLSATAILKDMFLKTFSTGNKNVETSLIEEFTYPKFGPGQLWEITAAGVQDMGGRILTEAKAVAVEIGTTAGRRAAAVIYEKDGERIREEADYVVSSMPLKDLVAGMNDVPEEIGQIARGLPYRDYITVGVLVPELKLKNRTKIPTIGDVIPDNWVYVHDRNVDMGRFQIYNNWSPYLVKDIEHTVWIGLEYFCADGDAMWSMEDDAFARKAIGEMVTLDLIGDAGEVLDYHVERVKKAYPAYFDTYERIDDLRGWLDTIPNLYCVGRNGQHRYNNIDHSMCTAFEAVEAIRNGSGDHSAIWNVNTEQEYHETDRDSETNGK